MKEFDAQLELPELRACLAEAIGLEGVDREACARLSEKVAQHAFNLVVAGEFKRGKSTVINALLGADLLPTGVVPLTSVVTRVQYGDTANATVIFDNGTDRAVALDALPNYVTERGNPKNAKGVREVQVAYPAEWLKGRIRLVDTPGIGSVHQHNTEVTYRYLPQADAVIFVASADQPASRAELDFLAHIRALRGQGVLPAEQAGLSLGSGTRGVRGIRHRRVTPGNGDSSAGVRDFGPARLARSDDEGA